MQSQQRHSITCRRCLRSRPHGLTPPELLAGAMDSLDLAAGVMEPPRIICCSAACRAVVSVGGCCGVGVGSERAAEGGAAPCSGGVEVVAREWEFAR